MVDLNQWLFEIPLEDIQDEAADGGPFATSCICCGRKVVNPKYLVHLLTNGNLISSAEAFDNSQGFFIIGASCRGKLPNNFYFNR
jgi:hypothetical protein